MKKMTGDVGFKATQFDWSTVSVPPTYDELKNIEDTILGKKVKYSSGDMPPVRVGGLTFGSFGDIGKFKIEEVPDSKLRIKIIPINGVAPEGLPKDTVAVQYPEQINMVENIKGDLESLAEELFSCLHCTGDREFAVSEAMGLSEKCLQSYAKSAHPHYNGGRKRGA